MLQLSLLSSLGISLGIFMVWVGLYRSRSDHAWMQRLALARPRQSVPEALVLEQPFWDRVVMPGIRRLMRSAGRLVPRWNAQQLEHELLLAGNPYGFTITDFLGLRLLFALVTGGTAFLALQVRHAPPAGVLALGLAMALLGALLPRFWLQRRVRMRQAEALRAMPDALDMLSIAVSAGLGFDAALQRISERWDHALAHEFGHVIREMQIGVSRRDALRNMAQRLAVPEISNFVAVLIQSDKLGISIGQVLQAQSAQVRLARRRRAEELARQAPIKMLFPLIFLIFPAIFVVILGPAIPILFGIFSHL